jgi:hypothetical protein
MHAIGLLAQPERTDAVAQAQAVLSLMSVWTAAHGHALMQNQGPCAADWESGYCAHLTTTTIAVMRSFISHQACEQAVTQSCAEQSIDAEHEPVGLLQHRGDFVLDMIACCADIFAFLFKNALAYLPLSAPTAAQEFLLDEIMNEWRSSRLSGQGSQEFWDVEFDWEVQMMRDVRDSMALQRCATVQESLLLSVPIILRYTQTCIQLLQSNVLSVNADHAQTLYIMRAMRCPCAPCHQISPSCKMDITAPLLFRSALSLAGAMSDGLTLVDHCMKSCVTSRTALVDHRTSDGRDPAPFRSRCTLLLASHSAWSTMVSESGISKSVACLVRDINSWLPPPAFSCHLPRAAAAAAMQIANAFEDQKHFVLHTLQLLLSCLVQTLQTFHDLESGADSFVVEHLDLETKCLGQTYLERQSFCDWASIRYPEMDSYIFQPHTLTAKSNQNNIDVLFATQAGFLCALHADAVLAPELQMAGASSICSGDCVVSLSEMSHDCEGAASNSAVHERRITFTDIVDRLLGSASPSSGAAPFTHPANMQMLNSLTQIHAVYVIDNGVEMKVITKVFC